VPVPLPGLPIGVQIITAPWREDAALRIAYALEASGVVRALRPSLQEAADGSRLAENRR
jgi:aspartyl-tRNA(Asn)/glutamyl-tRNA(Gln) amidotransferase subunit A